MPRNETCVCASAFRTCCERWSAHWRQRARDCCGYLRCRVWLLQMRLPSACAAHAGALCIGRFEELSANVYLPLPSEASLLFTFDLAVTVAHQEQVLAKESGLQALLTAFKDGYA